MGSGTTTSTSHPAIADVTITGANGLVGSALARLLESGGRRVRRVVRRANGSPGEVRWDPASRTIDSGELEGTGAVVHLAGENIANRRWSADVRRSILESRTHGTQFLSAALARLRRPPRVLVSASAVGFYGDRGDQILDETAGRGHGFLSDVCEQWEASTGDARDAGIRVVHLRIGVVLTPLGGALAKMLVPFRLGGGAMLGDGRQYVSWIALEDLLRAIVHVITDDRLEGPVNATSPAPVTNGELTRSLASVLRRPAFLRVPAFVLRTMLGEMADEMLLASTRAVPRRLDRSGFTFRHPELDDALAEMLTPDR